MFARLKTNMTAGRSFPDIDTGFHARAMEKAILLGASLLRTVRMARLLTEHGRIVDLAGLDRGIGLLCAKSLDLPPDLGRTLRPHLITLRNEVDTLTTAIRRQNAG